MNQPSESAKSRRLFLKKFGLGLSAAYSLPALGSTIQQDYEQLSSIKQRDEGYWQLVKEQFAPGDGMIMVNSANLCPPPLFILERLAQFQADLGSDVSFQNRGKFTDMRSRGLKALASFIGASEDEVGITRNTSESNNIIVNGLELGKKDEVIIWKQNHPSINAALKYRSKREGFKVIEIEVPESPGSIEDLIVPFENAINSKTRLVCFSHISNVTGIRMPVKNICEMVSDNGALTLVDGAQGLGFVDLDMKDLGCDFYTASAHKWLMGPFENGLLYVKKSRLEQVWPNLISAGWDEAKIDKVDSKLCVLGQRNVTSPAALVDIIDFHNTIGKTDIQERVVELNEFLRRKIQETIPDAKFITPLNSDLNANITILNIPGKNGADLFEELYTKHKIACAPTGGLRISPTINSTLEDMDRIVKAIS